MSQLSPPVFESLKKGVNSGSHRSARFTVDLPKKTGNKGIEVFKTNYFALHHFQKPSASPLNLQLLSRKK
jgi:hypothetical protein